MPRITATKLIRLLQQEIRDRESDFEVRWVNEHDHDEIYEGVGAIDEIYDMGGYEVVVLYGGKNVHQEQEPQ